jgi:hypothetical protein
MKVCVFDSLTTEFQNRVNLDKRLWHINEHADGACLLKVVIALSYPDTQATTSHIRTELTKTDVKIKALNFDIIKFNDWTKNQLAALHAPRGETTTDLLVNLFKGYEAVPDKEFLLYIASKKSRYEEGKPLTAEELMEMAQNKFKNKRQAQTWNLPTEEQEQIIALEARIENLQTQNRNLARRGQATGNKSNNPQGGRGQQQNRNRKQGGRGTQKKDRMQKGRDGDYLNATGKWAWLKTAPKTGEKTTKNFDGKPFFWCPKHARWGRHGPAQCRKGQENPKGGKPKDSQDTDTPQMRFANAYQALVDDDEEVQV